MPEKKPGRRASRAGGGGSGFPDVIYAQASPRSLGGVSLFAPGARVDAETVMGFSSDEDYVLVAAQRLRDAGFDVLQVSPITINIAGPRERYEQAFATELVTEEREVIKEGAREDTATFVEDPSTDVPGLIDVSGTSFADVLEGVAIEVPRYFMQSPLPPTRAYWHLDVPADVSLGCNADRAHRGGITGRGIKVVMTDTGWFAHPFFTQRGYRASPAVLGPGTSNPAVDANGHGTAESANVFATAPDVDFTMVKLSFVNTTGAFNAAVALGPHIISNSWGSDVRSRRLDAVNQALAAAIALAVSNGIIVVFAAGNGHHGFPGQHPDVISAGGAFMLPDGTVQASDYASGFASTVYPGRNCPDVCGLVGMRPRAAYIMLPLAAGCSIDQGMAGGTHPNGDETAPDDGWAAISGTSAAAPQLAGVCALVKQACPRLRPHAVRDILMRTARDVTTGASNPISGGHPAGPGVDLATGHGLVDAHRAVLLAKLRCLGPIRPPRPVPITPIRPQPVQPEPVRPQPIQPEPIQPRPIGPGPVRPAEGGGEAAWGEVEEAGGPLSAEDVAALEEMIREGRDLDI